jgi:hypothetical protein
VEDLAAAGDPVATLLWENTFPGRTGEVAMALRQGWYTRDPGYGDQGADHGSPWEADRHVPLVLAGHGIATGRVDAPVKVIDAIRTLSDRLGLDPVEGGGDPLP